MSDESFLSLEDLTEEAWKQIESLARQVLQTGVYGDNEIRSSVAAFVLWLSENQVGLAIDQPSPKEKKRRKSHGVTH